MWQRKQTVFLLLAVVLAAVTLCSDFYSWGQHAILVLAAAVNLLTVFLYRRRPLQVVLCTISLFLYLGWYLALVVFSKQQAPDASQFQLPWSAVLPAVCLILVVMARQAVKSDERLVRAADRLR